MQTAESVEGIASELEVHVHHRSEAGLFADDSTISGASLAAEIKKARDLIASGDLAGANQVLLEAYSLLHSAINRKSILWRAIHIHALDIYIYLTVWAVGLVIAGKACVNEQEMAFWGVPVTMLVFGALGGVLRGLWWITKKVEARNLRTQFRPQYYAAPVIAGILGMGAYLLADFLTAGLSAGDVATKGTTETAIGVNALAFIAGFYWEWIIEKIKAASS